MVRDVDSCEGRDTVKSKVDCKEEGVVDYQRHGKFEDYASAAGDFGGQRTVQLKRRRERKVVKRRLEKVAADGQVGVCIEARTLADSCDAYAGVFLDHC